MINGFVSIWIFFFEIYTQYKAAFSQFDRRTNTRKTELLFCIRVITKRYSLIILQNGLPYVSVRLNVSFFFLCVYTRARLACELCNGVWSYRNNKQTNVCVCVCMDVRVYVCVCWPHCLYCSRIMCAGVLLRLNGPNCAGSRTICMPTYALAYEWGCV